MKIHNEFSGTITLTENSSRELFKVLQEQDEAFINDMLDGRCGFTLKSADGRSVELVPKADRPQEWIPCSERLPSDDNDYLVVDGDGEMAVGYYRDDADAWDNSCFGWLERDDEDEHPTRLGKVVAWMPLPKPWKGADDE